MIKINTTTIKNLNVNIKVKSQYKKCALRDKKLKLQEKIFNQHIFKTIYRRGTFDTIR